MSYTALITGLPTVRPTDLSDLEHLIRTFEVDVRHVPFPDGLSCGSDNALVFVFVAAQGSSLHVFFWDPGFLALLSEKRHDARLYDILMNGCVDFFLWPCHQEEFAARIRRLKERVDTRRVWNDPSIRGQAYKDLGLVGCSDRFISALELTAKFSRYEVPVLLEGETGTGKELFVGHVCFSSSNTRISGVIPASRAALQNPRSKVCIVAVPQAAR